MGHEDIKSLKFDKKISTSRHTLQKLWTSLDSGYILMGCLLWIRTGLGNKHFRLRSSWSADPLRRCRGQRSHISGSRDKRFHPRRGLTRRQRSSFSKGLIIPHDTLLLQNPGTLMYCFVFFWQKTENPKLHITSQDIPINSPTLLRGRPWHTLPSDILGLAQRLVARSESLLRRSTVSSDVTRWASGSEYSDSV